MSTIDFRVVAGTPQRAVGSDGTFSGTYDYSEIYSAHNSTRRLSLQKFHGLRIRTCVCGSSSSPPCLARLLVLLPIGARSYRNQSKERYVTMKLVENETTQQHDLYLTPSASGRDGARGLTCTASI